MLAAGLALAWQLIKIGGFVCLLLYAVAHIAAWPLYAAVPAAVALVVVSKIAWRDFIETF